MTHHEVDHSKLRLPRVLIKMKRKIDLVEEEREREDEENECSSDESENEEPRIKDVLVIFPERCRKSVLLICCIVWPLPKTFFSGLPADNYFEIIVSFSSQTSAT